MPGQCLYHPLAVDLVSRRVAQNMQPDEPGQQILELLGVPIEFRNWNEVCRRPLMRRRAGLSSGSERHISSEETGHGKCG